MIKIAKLLILLACQAKFVAEAVKFVAEAATATRMVGDLVDYFKSAPALEQALLS